MNPHTPRHFLHFSYEVLVCELSVCSDIFVEAYLNRWDSFFWLFCFDLAVLLLVIQVSFLAPTGDPGVSRGGHLSRYLLGS